MDHEAPRKLTPELVRALLDEGRELRRCLDADIAKMREHPCDCAQREKPKSVE